MAENKDLKVDELNFDLIKANFKNYLQSQDNFRDYNFEASGINTLLDLLAYNTYYNSFYLNMASAEAFLSTAQKRNSVVALAKSLNYTPRSRTAARIEGVITATTVSSPATITVPQYTEFTGTIDNTTYTFLTEEDVILASANSYRGSVSLKEGKVLTRRFTVNTSDTDQRFLIPNSNVDTSTLVIRVLDSSVDSTSRTFTKVDNLVELNSTDQIYYLEEVEDGQFEVKFGDNIFGTSLENGNIIVMTYTVTSDKDANDIQALTYADSISGISTISFTASDPATGGADRETISSIKFNAPKSYESQNRVVTAEDYKALMLRQSSVDSVAVWGGEDNDPPAFGKVYIAIKPTVGQLLTATEKQNLINTVINPKKILTVSTEIVDPEFIFLLISTTVKYDSDSTTLSEDAIKALVISVIQNYNTAEINSFSKYFRYSKLSRLIDVAERSILNNSLTITLRKETAIQLGVGTRYEINFSNPVNSTTLGRPATHPFGAGNQISSNAFTFAGQPNCFLDDNDGIIRVFRALAGENVGVNSNVGTIDYNTGRIILNNFNPTSFADGTSTLKITAIPKDKDILPLRNQILIILPLDINVTLIDDKTISLVNR
jgi:hypothetical protein